MTENYESRTPPFGAIASMTKCGLWIPLKNPSPARTTVTATSDRREALSGADYVVVMIQSGGGAEFRQDYEILMKSGVD